MYLYFSKSYPRKNMLIHGMYISHIQGSCTDECTTPTSYIYPVYLYLGSLPCTRCAQVGFRGTSFDWELDKRAFDLTGNAAFASFV